MKSRGFIVWGSGIIVVLGLFLIFVADGWPGNPNSCIPEKALNLPVPPPNATAARRQYVDTTVKESNCYCEEFWVPDVKTGASGVRQPVNTWFNLYAIFTSLIVAVWVHRDRKRDLGTTPIQTHLWLPDLYIFVVLFLGLGSMWFHGALKEWGGITDTLSMYMYAGFLVFYTIYRMWNSDAFFLIGYSITVVVFTIIGELWQKAMPTFPVSLILILILVVAYLVLESIIWRNDGAGTKWQNWWDHVSWGGNRVSWRWWIAVGCILAATFFWISSQTGNYMCDIHSFFQPHGLLWHPLAGVMAVFLYFYWREERARLADDVPIRYA
jgi:hypothetical protein